MTPGSSFTEMTVPELENARRDLRAGLGLLVPGSPAVPPIMREMTAIDAELASRDQP